MKRSSLVCRLNRALYGLKLVHQASFERLRLSLMQLRFQSSRAYQSLFMNFSKGISIYVSVSVDDILVTGGDLAEITHSLLT